MRPRTLWRFRIVFRKQEEMIQLMRVCHTGWIRYAPFAGVDRADFLHTAIFRMRLHARNSEKALDQQQRKSVKPDAGNAIRLDSSLTTHNIPFPQPIEQEDQRWTCSKRP